MNGETFQVLLHGLLTGAFARKRKELGLTIKDRGMILADAWTGFHSYKTGLDRVRLGWSEQTNVKLPSPQAGIGYDGTHDTGLRGL